METFAVSGGTTAASDYAIDVRNLRKSYGKVEVLKGVNFQVRRGSLLALLGPNGAGKTTTVRILATLLKPTSGTAYIFGHDIVREAKAVQQLVSLTGQFASVDEELTGRENLVMIARLLGFPWRQARSRADELLEAFDLAEAGNRLVKNYSGGMRRRLDIAASIVVAPEILFLDEPTTGLDPQARHLMWERLKLLLQQGKSILLTTHFMDEAERLCDRLLVLDLGQKIAEGTPRGLIAQHLESDVVEVYGEGAPATAERHRALADRVEVIGETVFFYLRQPRPLLEVLSRDPAVRYLHRPANLEDLFLKLTGRQIRDDA